MQNQLSTQTSVDSHFHVFEAQRAVPGARYSPRYAATLATWREASQAVGVTHGVLVQPSFLGTDNTYLLAQLKQHPDTLRGVAVVAPTVSFGLLEDLNGLGVRGIRLNLAGQSHDMAAWSAAKPLWDAVLRLGWHVELHTDAGALPKVLAALPQALSVVIDHFGKPEKASLLDETVVAVQRRSTGGVLSNVTNVYVKLSAAYRLQAELNPKDLAALWLGELGPLALLWGSDWPCTNFEAKADYPALHGALEDWLGQDAGAVQAARSANPMRLYWG
jgi:predicted TIM-barrel fold metal-dependent hydrolase